MQVRHWLTACYPRGVVLHRPPFSDLKSAHSNTGLASGAGSDSDSGEHSPNGVKGSTMDDPRQGGGLGQQFWPGTGVLLCFCSLRRCL